MPTKFTCLNGKFVPAAEAMLPVADRGFRFGDGVFETIRLTAGVPYQWAWHMARLRASLEALRIPSPVENWVPFAHELLALNAAREGFIRLAISRGVGSQGYAPSVPAPSPNWVMEYLEPTPSPAAPASLWPSRYARMPLACLPTNQKLAQGLGSTLALLEAQEHECSEALQLTPDGMLCEAASANVFWVHHHALYTPALDTGCLNGSTRAALLRLSPVPIAQVQQPFATLASADAVFLTNCRVGIWPVARIATLDAMFDVQHPHILALQTALMQDRARDAQAQQAQWMNA